MTRSVLTLAALFLLAGCAEKRRIPRPDPDWMPVGGTESWVTSVDTAHIGEEGSARVVRLRMDSVTTDAEGEPVLVRGARRESLHRVRCADRTVDDLRIGPDDNRGLPGPTDLVVLRGGIRFAEHPYGPGVFPATCNAIGTAGVIRANEQKQ